MRKSLLFSTAAAVLGLTIMAGPTWAEDKAATSATHASAMGTVDAKKLIGEDVRNGAGDRVGDINTVILDKSGQVKTVVVGVGGFLGVGEKEVALPWHDLKMAPNGDHVIANVTKDQLKAMPEYKFHDPNRRGTIFSD